MAHFRAYVVLHCLSLLNGERSINAIYHLVQGKKSSQTIQDAKLFKLEAYFQAMQHLSKNDIDDIVFDLEAKEYIIKTNKDTYILAEKGLFYLEKLVEIYPIPTSLNGWRYHKKAKVFWHRLSLTVQSLSFLLYEQSTFLPIINEDDTQKWVKRYLKSNGKRSKIADELFTECRLILKKIHQQQAEIFVLHLSGFHRVGYTIEQISNLLQLDKEYAFILFQSVLHHIISTIETNPDEFSQLLAFLEQDKNIETLTVSSQKTYELLKRSKSISEISVIRNLKESTIEDHIVEIASEINDFNIEPFVSREQQDQILKIYSRTGTKRLKPIRNALNDAVSYFQIRLVLGRMEK